MVGWKVVSPSSCYPPPGTFPLLLHAFPILSDKGGHHCLVPSEVVYYAYTDTPLGELQVFYKLGRLLNIKGTLFSTHYHP